MQPLDITSSPFNNDLSSWGRTLCIAPHPDDESLGCGGTLALLAKAGLPTAVAWVSDGGLSHPNSVKYPRAALAQLRETEALNALQVLGFGPESGYFQRLPDGALPQEQDRTFDQAVASALSILADFQPETLLLPWRRDPHRDHRAAWAIWTCASQSFPLQHLEYMVWAFERASPNEWPSSHETEAFRVDISSVLPLKLAAISTHKSQTTRLIDDDPDGFWLSPEVIRQFERPYEVWLRPYSHQMEDAALDRPDFEQINLERAGQS